MDAERARSRAGQVGEVRLDVDVGRSVSAAPRGDEPFHILLLGDFRGRGETAMEPLADVGRRRAVAVDRDDFDEVLGRFAPRLTVGPAGGVPEQTILFRELDDFHPDRLFGRLPLFSSLRELRERLGDPGGFEAALTEPEGAQRPPAPTGPEDGDRAGAVPPPDGLLDRILGEADAEVPPAARAADPLAAYVRRLVAPHLLSGPDPRQPELLAELDAAVTRSMRALLHDRGFQALEALWRGVFLLVRRLETGPSLRVHLLDLTRGELAADLEPGRPLEETALYRLLVEPTREAGAGVPSSLLIGHYTWGATDAELRQLGRLGRIARLAGAPWIAAADPRLLGCPSFGTTPDPDDWTAPAGAAWDELRRGPDAAALGLVLPRFLLRLPYGEQTDPCEAARFEECYGAPDHEEYLWGNPALACGLLLATSFHRTDAGPPRLQLELKGLPLHLVRSGGELFAKPCAEALMTERTANRILEAGVMPLASLKDRDTVRLVRFQSIAHPAAALAGRWTSAAGR